MVGGSSDKYVRLWNVRNGRLLHTLCGPTNGVLTTAFNPAGALLAAGALGGDIFVWAVEQQDDLTKVQLRHHLQGHTVGVNSVAFSPDGQQLVNGASDETIGVWDIESGVCINILRAEGPYAGMDITGITGLTDAQKAALVALGTVEEHTLVQSIAPSPIAASFKTPDTFRQNGLAGQNATVIK